MKKQLMLMLLAVSLQANAKFLFTGNEYLASASTEQYGFILGTVNSDWAKNYCIPAGVTIVQVNKVFIKYMQDHPQYLHTDATFLFDLALIQAKWKWCE